MFTSALVALDLSPAEEPLLDCLPDLKKWGINRLVLAHVVAVGYNQFAGFGHEDDFRAWLENCAAPLREAGLEVTVVVRSAGVVADEILALAAGIEMDLVVIGSRGQSRARRLFLGSVARDVIRKATRPVLLQWIEPSADGTRERCEAVCKHALGHILLATDLSRQAAGAERAFVELAARSEQSDLLTVLTPDALAATPALPTVVAAALDDIRKRLAPRSEPVTPLLEKGRPCDAIARIAGELDCTLVIVGKHGQGWLESKVIGSTAAKVCETARRPVLVVPIHERDET